MPLDLVKTFAPETNRHLGECSEKNTKKVLGCHLLLDMKGTYASDIRHKNKFLPHLELKKHISRMVANENKFPLSTL